MLLTWNIRYVDRSDKQFKTRHLYLDTKTLDPVTRAAVELAAESQSLKTERAVLKYRNLFVENRSGKIPGDVHQWGKIVPVGPSEYFEDETGEELTGDEMGPILTGNPFTVFVPHGAQQHDIEFKLSEPKPMPIAGVTLDSEQIRLFGIFDRDLRATLDSAFMKDGPGSLKGSINSDPKVETAVTADEIQSFVMTFRRLYMTSRRDPANFSLIVPIFVTAVGDHPRSRWVKGTAKEYENYLASTPFVARFMRPSPSCTTKQLIDVFLYTQYAHQPDKKKQDEFEAFVKEVHGNRQVLTWMFLSEIHFCARKIASAGDVIVRWFNRYCDHHGIKPNVLKSLGDDHAGLGATEKEADRQARLFQEKVEQLADELWRQAGAPAGGSSQYLATAHDQLKKRLQQ